MGCHCVGCFVTTLGDAAAWVRSRGDLPVVRSSSRIPVVQIVEPWSEMLDGRISKCHSIHSFTAEQTVFLGELALILVRNRKHGGDPSDPSLHVAAPLILATAVLAHMRAWERAAYWSREVPCLGRSYCIKPLTCFLILHAENWKDEASVVLMQST